EDGIRDRTVTGVQTCALPIFGGLVGVFALYYLIELFIAPVDWGSAALHMALPHIPDDEALLLAVGIFGATVMPHAIYLHSGLTRSEERRVGKECRYGGARSVE